MQRETKISPKILQLFYDFLFVRCVCVQNHCEKKDTLTLFHLFECSGCEMTKTARVDIKRERKREKKENRIIKFNTLPFDHNSITKPTHKVKHMHTTQTLGQIHGWTSNFHDKTDLRVRTSPKQKVLA